MSKRSAGLRQDFQRNHGRRQSVDPLYRTVAGTIRGAGLDHGKPLGEGTVASLTKRLCGELRGNKLAVPEHERRDLLEASDLQRAKSAVRKLIDTCLSLVAAWEDEGGMLDSVDPLLAALRDPALTNYGGGPSA